MAFVFAGILLAINAFFVAGEFSVISTRREQLEPLVEARKRGAKEALWALENTSLMLAVNQLGITLASTGLGAVAEPAVAHLIEKPLEKIGMPAGMLHPVAFLIALLIVVLLHIVVGEMVPKNFTVSASLRVSCLLAPIMVPLARKMSPIVGGLNSFANIFLRLLGIEPKDEVEATFTLEEVAAIVEHSEKAGTLEDDLGLLSGSLELSQEQVATVMLPLEKITTITWPFTPSYFDEQVAKTGFSRFIVTEQGSVDAIEAEKEATVTTLNSETVQLDSITELSPQSATELIGEGKEHHFSFPGVNQETIMGYIHVKDMLYADTEELREQKVESWRIRQLPEVEQSTEIEEALRVMQNMGVHLALVKQGNKVSGVVFLEDILEELVGEVRDAMPRL